MTSVTQSVDVRVPVRTAYNQWTQFETFPHFMDGVESITQTDDPHRHWKTRSAVWCVSSTPRSPSSTRTSAIAWKSAGGDTRHAGVVTFHRLGDQDTRVTVQLDWQPEGVVEKAGAAVGRRRPAGQGRRERFKEYVEERGSETGQWRGDVETPDKR